MKVDGGASVNNFICQFLADQTSTEVCRPETFETTALGAVPCRPCGGLWPDQQAIADNWRCDQEYQPAGIGAPNSAYRGWKRAVERSEVGISMTKTDRLRDENFASRSLAKKPVIAGLKGIEHVRRC